MPTAFVHAVRSWTGAKGIALFATIAFTVGIGATTAIYTVVRAVLLAPLPYANGDRFVALYGARYSEPGQFSSNSFPDLQEYQRRTTSFDVFGWYRLDEVNLTSPGDPQHLRVTFLTPSLANNLGVSPFIGRWFGDDSGAVISSRLWRRLGADASIVGRPMTLDGRALTITGVMPAPFRLPVNGPGNADFESDVWAYLDPSGKGFNPSAFYYFAYARRKPGVTLAQAEADVKRAAGEIVALDPASHPSYTARLVDLRDASVTDVRPTLLLLLAASALLLLITSANIAGLLLTRSVARTRETATRVALGASWRQLALQYLLETLVVSLPAAVAGVVASVGLVRLVISLGPDLVPRADEVGMEWTGLAFALGVAVLASVLAGIAPLWQALRTSPGEALSAGVRASVGARVRHLSQALVVGEIALAFALLAVSGALIAHLRVLVRTPTGFEADHLTTFSIAIPNAIASNDVRRPPYQKRIADAVRAIPGVTAAGYSNRLPLTGCCLSVTIHREGHPIESKAVERTSYVITDPGYFLALQIPLRRGRFLLDSDTSENPLHVVINQAAATRDWGDEDPINTLGRIEGQNGSTFQVVGVIGDVRNNGLGRPTEPEIYLPSAIATADSMEFAVRSSLPPEHLIPAIRRAVRSVDPELPIHDARTMNDIIRNSVSLERVGSMMTSLFALAALLMTTIGVYGVVAYGVRQRTVEIGTRMALGAVRGDVLSLVIRGGLKMAAVGVVAGGFAVAGATPLIVRVFALHDVGWLPVLTSLGIVTVVATTASSIPAWRATQLSPMVAIRDESRSVWASAAERMRTAWRGLTDAFTPSVEAPSVSEAALLADFVTAARQAESPTEQLHRALETLRTRLGAESAWLFEQSSVAAYRSVATAPDGGAPMYGLPADGFLVGRLRANAAPLPTPQADLEALKRWAAEHRPERLAEIETLSTIGVRVAAALRTNREILGILLVGAPADRQGYSRPERNVLHACAAQFALMLENGRLTRRVVEQERLRRDLTLAGEVQRRFLPETAPEVSVAELAGLSLPARTVGGDYFDFLDLGGHQLGIALADVAGKGVAAALIMSAVQASLRILSAESVRSLPQLVAKMNHFLYQSTPSSSYATFFFAQVDERARQLRYVNAGHLPPYLWRSSTREIEELSTGGPVIGLLPETCYEEATVNLWPGDVLVAFTDGVTEAMNAHEDEFGEERLKQLLRQTVHLPAKHISAQIAEALREWIGDVAQYDDMTFVVMRVA